MIDTSTAERIHILVELAKCLPANTLNGKKYHYH